MYVNIGQSEMGWGVYFTMLYCLGAQYSCQHCFKLTHYIITDMVRNDCFSSDPACASNEVLYCVL
jgi:hypothetical protein